MFRCWYQQFETRLLKKPPFSISAISYRRLYRLRNFCLVVQVSLNSVCTYFVCYCGAVLLAENENKSTQKSLKVNYRHTAKPMALALQINCKDLMQFKLKRPLLKHKFTRMIHGPVLHLQDNFNLLTPLWNVIKVSVTGSTWTSIIITVHCNYQLRQVT